MTTNKRDLVNAWETGEAVDSPSRFLPTEASSPSNYQQQRLVSVSCPAPDMSARAFLRQATGQPRFFWRDGTVEANQRPFTFAGFGIAANLTAWGPNRYEHIQAQAAALFADSHISSQLAAPRLFGGFSFRDDFTPDNTWSIYTPAQFILPHYQLTQLGDSIWLTINTLVDAEESLPEIVAELETALTVRTAVLRQKIAQLPATTPATPGPPHIQYPMSIEQWSDNILHAVDTMNSTPLNKVVLARVCEARFETFIHVDSMLDYLSDTYSDCYQFLFEPRPHHAFVGATPELLVRVNGRSLTTMGLAGSIARGKTAAEDQTLAQTLFNSQKDRHEHELVVDSIRRRLAGVVTELDAPETPTVIPFNNIQHLYTPVNGRLQTAQGVLPLVKQLHPTPALGGSPRDLAMAFIQEAEPVPRGWYAAPIGLIDHQLDGAFGVAIRSAVVEEDRAWLYAGAGIVPDSNPQTEWEETGLKFTPMLRALGIGNS